MARGRSSIRDSMTPRVFRSRRAQDSGHVRADEDLITALLPALQLYQLALPVPSAPRGSYDRSAAKRGESVFNGKANAAECHVPPLYTEPGWNMHTGAEIGIDEFQASRAPDGRYRTTPLRGLWTHTKGGFYHDGRFRNPRGRGRTLRLAFLAGTFRRGEASSSSNSSSRSESPGFAARKWGHSYFPTDEAQFLVAGTLGRKIGMSPFSDTDRFASGQVSLVNDSPWKSSTSAAATSGDSRSAGCCPTRAGTWSARSFSSTTSGR